MMPQTRTLLLLAGLVVGYFLLLFANPARASLRDGLRCLRRHPQLWTLPAFCGFVHACYQLATRFVGIAAQPPAPWTGWSPPDWRAAAIHGALPAVEGVAGIFNVLIGTEPVAALAALLFLAHWRGYSGELGRALRRRFGWARGIPFQVLLMLCALAAFLKPALLLLGHQRLLGAVPGTTAEGGALVLALPWLLASIEALGFVFECCLGVALQMYLISLAFAWVRGFGFERDALRRFALRRFVGVLPWTLTVLALGAVGIQLPLFLLAADVPLSTDWALGWVQAGRWLLAFVLLTFATVQLSMVFHRRTLRAAVRNNWRLWRRHGSLLGWLMTLALIHFALLTTTHGAFVAAAGGEGSWPANGLLLLFPLAWSALGGWLLASWVCLFRRLERDRPEAEDLVEF
ncbi:MAG: hypothetical protein JO117_06595 [Verrucomicrobia bacterium]|nr:hypothetical protein [Verrucomicrobiota bacterium]